MACCPHRVLAEEAGWSVFPAALALVEPAELCESCSFSIALLCCSFSIALLSYLALRGDVWDVSLRTGEGHTFLWQQI